MSARRFQTSEDSAITKAEKENGRATPALGFVAGIIPVAVLTVGWISFFIWLIFKAWSLM